MNRESIRVYQYHPKHKPLLDGAVLTSRLENTPHGKYSWLIEIIPTPPDTEAGRVKT